MARALDQATAVVEKPVGQPLQGNPAMGAAVLVGVNAAVLAHQQQVQVVDQKAPALTFGQFVGAAEQDHRHLHGRRALWRAIVACQEGLVLVLKGGPGLGGDFSVFVAVVRQVRRMMAAGIPEREVW